MVGGQQGVDTTAGRADLPLMVGDTGVGVVKGSVEGDEGADHRRAGADPGVHLLWPPFATCPLGKASMTLTH